MDELEKAKAELKLAIENLSVSVDSLELRAKNDAVAQEKFFLYFLRKTALDIYFNGINEKPNVTVSQVRSKIQAALKSKTEILTYLNN